MNTPVMILQNRKAAGQKLAIVLSPYVAEKPIILGIPRGGVVVAYEVARALHAPLDIVVARKISAPLYPEYAIGAVAPPDIRVFNLEAITALGIKEQELEAIIAQETQEMERRLKLYRGKQPVLQLKDRVVIIVDDGVATSQTALAAIRSARTMQPRKIILACGVIAHEAIMLLQPEVDAVIAVHCPKVLYAVGQWYQNFDQTPDIKVTRLLRQAATFIEINEY